jgi:hypothetical protein
MAERPFFSSVKPTKKSIGENKTTLDNLHQIQITELQNDKQQIQSIDQEIQKLEKEIRDTNDIIQKTQKEEILYHYKQKLNDLQENKPIYNYYFETGEILYKYYDLQEKIQKGGGGITGKACKIKPGSVLAAFQEFEEEIKKPQKPVKEEEGRDVLLDKYLEKVNPHHTKNMVNNFDDPYGVCDRCDNEMTFSANEALFYCENCGHQEFVLIDSDKPSYKDPPREVTYYAYKRINHFNELLAQFQAKESTEIPDEVFQSIIEELRKERVTNTENVKPAKIREILKKLKYQHYYEHITYILNRINGKTAPVMTREVEEKLRFMFKEIQSSFIKHCPKNRSNFLSYHYVIYKFCELLELDEYLPCFPLLKNRDKLYNQDKIWQMICADHGWQFIRSI